MYLSDRPRPLQGSPPGPCTGRPPSSQRLGSHLQPGPSASCRVPGPAALWIPAQGSARTRTVSVSGCRGNGHGVTVLEPGRRWGLSCQQCSSGPAWKSGSCLRPVRVSLEKVGDWCTPTLGLTVGQDGDQVPGGWRPGWAGVRAGRRGCRGAPEEEGAWHLLAGRRLWPPPCRGLGGGCADTKQSPGSLDPAEECAASWALATRQGRWGCRR